jgi:type II secretory pathway pseudopilin PulG
MKLLSSARVKTFRGAAYTLPEVVIAAAVLGMLSVSLLAAFSSGLTLVRAGRENMRATQIMLQKTEAVRLLTWTQGRDTSLATSSFTDFYDPTRTNTQSGGVTYSGFFSNSAAPTTIPAAYRDSMRTATVTVYWTNYPTGSSNAVVHSRQYQTFVARYGMQNYVF